MHITPRTALSTCFTPHTHPYPHTAPCPRPTHTHSSSSDTRSSTRTRPNTLIIHTLEPRLSLQHLLILNRVQNKLTNRKRIHEAIAAVLGIATELLIRVVAAQAIEAQLWLAQGTVGRFLHDLCNVDCAAVHHAQGIEVGAQIVSDEDGLGVDVFVQCGAGGRPAFEDFVPGLSRGFHVAPAGEPCGCGVPCRDLGVGIGADEMVHEYGAGGEVDSGQLDYFVTVVCKADFAACQDNDTEAWFLCITRRGRLEVGEIVIGVVLVGKGLGCGQVLALKHSW